MKALLCTKMFLCFFFILVVQSISSQEWQTLNASTLSWRFEDLQFVNEDVGWVVDGGGQILKTSNGGLNWSQQFYDNDYYFRSVEFFNESIGFAGTLANGNPNASLFKTIDGGQTWTDISSSLPETIPGICGMHMVNESTIFITGVFYGSGYIMKSIDQGATWTYTNMQDLCNGIVDIYFKDETIGYAVGQSAQGTGLRGIIVRTADGGNTWNTVALFNESNTRVWKIQELNDNIMYASVEAFTPSPKYYKSTDGGLTWDLNEVTSADISGTIQGVGFLNEAIGWVGGFSTFFHETTDQGENWEYKPDIGTSFNRFQRINDTLMYASGINVYKYVDPEQLSIDEFEMPLPVGHTMKIKGSNVISDSAILELNLVNTTYCELSIYNTRGQQIQRLSQGMRTTGDYNIPFQVNSLSKGQYFMVLYTYHGYESIKIIVNK